MNIKILFFTITISVFLSSIKAQEVVTAQHSIDLALKHNYGIKVANNNIKVAENNADILNSGYLPSVALNANGFYNIDNVEANFSDGTQTVLKGANSSNYGASLDVNYTIFDGLGRSYNYKQLKETKKLSELETRATIENTVYQLLTRYYSLAETIENENALVETLQISKDRLTRAGFQFEYGQKTKLEVLNAQVDVNNDSINVITVKQQVTNFKRDFNLILGNVLNDSFKTDTLIKFNNLYDKKQLYEKAKLNNISLLQVEKNIAINELAVKSSKSSFLPTVNLVGSYGWGKNNNNSASFISSSINDGLTGGLTLSWGLFDGGSNITKVRNAEISLDTQDIQQEELQQSVKTNFENAWDDYQNKLSVYKLLKNNIKTSLDNFNRTKEKFKIGQVNSVDFRQAQLNLLNAEVSKNQAKYQAKLAELLLMQIAGEILNVKL